MSASSSSDWLATVLPTLRLPRRAVCSAIVGALLGGQRETTSRSPESFERRTRDPIRRVAPASCSRRKARDSLSAKHPASAYSSATSRNQNALTFVSLASAAETDDHRGEWAVHPRAAGQCRIPARNIDQLTKPVMQCPRSPPWNRKSPLHGSLLHSEHLDSRKWVAWAAR